VEQGRVGADEFPTAENQPAGERQTAEEQRQRPRGPAPLACIHAPTIAPWPDCFYPAASIAFHDSSPRPMLTSLPERTSGRPGLTSAAD